MQLKESEVGRQEGRTKIGIQRNIEGMKGRSNYRRRRNEGKKSEQESMERMQGERWEIN